VRLRYTPGFVYPNRTSIIALVLDAFQRGPLAKMVVDKDAVPTKKGVDAVFP